jgi:hypothetical protein
MYMQIWQIFTTPSYIYTAIVHESNFLNKICAIFGRSSFIELTLGIHFFIVYD